MKFSSPFNGPLIIGGIGGSGTRVIAEIVSGMGYYLGKDLNTASDNLTFTLLFKRPDWLRRNFDNKKRFYSGLSILEKTLFTGASLNLRERLFLRKAVRQMEKYGHNPDGEGKGDWPLHRKPFIMDPALPESGKYIGWGWKEPNSHLLIPCYDQYFSHFKYIHTVRHGLDMAYSSNQQQMFNWSGLFGLKTPDDPSEIPSASLKYWIKANQRVSDLVGQSGDDNILIIHFEDLCFNPLEGIRKIAGFLGVGLNGEQIEELAKLPVMPHTSGRYKKFPLKNFDPDDLLLLEKMGFDCTV